MFNTLVLAFAAFSAASPALSAYIERAVAFNERDFPVSHLSARGENGTSPSINGSYIVSLIESRVGKQLGGTNNNSTGDLDEGGWPLNCSDQCASFKAFVKDKGLCQVYSIDTNDSSQMTCSGTFKIRASDFCTNLDKAAPCYYCLVPEPSLQSEMKDAFVQDLVVCKKAGVSIPKEVEGVDMSKVSAAYAMSISAAVAVTALGTSLLMLA